MLLQSIFIVFIVKCKGYECPHYDNVHEIEDGASERFENDSIFSCKHDFKELLHTWECQILIFSCTFNSMIGTSNGGAIYLEYGNIPTVHPENIIKDCKFINCKSEAGGAIYIDGYNGTLVTITNTIFDSNSASSSIGGGAIYFESCYPTITKCRFTNNDATTGTCIRYFYRSGEQKGNYIYLAIQDCFFSHNIAGSYKKVGMIYFCQSNSYDMKFNCTGNEIDLSNVEYLSFFYSFAQNLLSWSKLNFTNNYISPFERARFLGNMNLLNIDFEGNNHQYPKPAETDFIYEGHKEDEKVEEKIKHIGSSEKSMYVKIYDSAFKDFESEGDGGLFYFENVIIQCKNSKITGCKSTNGAGGAIYIKNTNDQITQINITNTQFINCIADYGGAIYIYSNSKNTNVLIESCLFKENKAMKSSGAKSGGSAIYCSIIKGNISDCQFFNNYGSSQIKITSISKESMKLLNSDSLSFLNCNFVANIESKEIIYFVGHIGKVLNIFRCNFIGKLAKGVNYIDGEIDYKNHLAIRLEDCSFEYDKINKKLIISYLSSSESFMRKYLCMILISVGAVFLCELLVMLKNSQIKDQDIESSNTKQTINESL